MKSLKWAILGPGLIAKDFAAAITEVNGEIYAVGSRSYDRAEAFANQYGISKAYENYEEMLKDEVIDVVYISTPHSNHYEYIMMALKYNKHVICEKAIVLNGSQLKNIIALAKEKNLVVAEAMTIYHMPLFKKLKNLINEGAIGQLKMINVSFGSCKEYDITNRFFNKELAGGALFDIGSYALSLTRMFLSEQPDVVMTTVKKFETGVDEQSGIILKNSKDEMAVVTLTMRAKLPKRAVIAGDLGYITVEDYPRADEAVITYLNGTVEKISCGHKNKALLYEVEDMNNSILNLNKADDLNSLNLSKDVMSIMDEIRRQWGISYGKSDEI
ncbi:Gfo/Idh/MocA family protein [Clostridium fungisolvens]|uniref:Scyllo-inositol 2-dehydrogenase (NADP(+)) IolU n=1 Tax=Clostridium fungisolvens TaxID=1604897 RepID=A0A6V8SNW9_9CLOT|nr:Gfo/Idh/MocA family oxidoreductase [Clostridium fungisolvens]GFP76908.1 scyllo-inositol 2-dehydrogenase (NADP(+)) IolU [Clostridium fungisolvens]